MRPVVRSSIALAVFSGILLCTSGVQAELLIEESFDYPLAEGESMLRQPVTGVGLFGEFRARAGDPLFQENSLDFGEKFFPLRGGSVRLAAAPGDARNASALVANLGVPAIQGDLWASMLFKIHENFGHSNSILGMRVSGDSGAEPGEHLYVAAKAQNTRGTYENAHRPGVRYAGGNVLHNLGAAEPNDRNLDIDTTYLAVAKFTNVGLPTSMESPGEARLWVFDQPSYELWRSVGNSAEETLGDYALWMAHHSLPGLEEMESGEAVFDDRMQLHLHYYDGNGEMAATLDEVRWGTTLGAVAIPE